MADIFISYKSEDRPRIRPLAQALERCGYTVWWDLELVAGQKFSRKIRAELEASRCVVVAWTRLSVLDNGDYATDWIEREANHGANHGALVPAMLDQGRVAWPHENVQYANLIGWQDGLEHPGITELLKGVAQHAGERLRPEDAELSAWADAERSGAAEGYRAFLLEHPNSRFADQARARIGEIEELAAWRALGPAPAISALALFMRRFPRGRFADEAAARIAALEGARPAAPADADPPKTGSGVRAAAGPGRLPRWAPPVAGALGVVAIVAALVAGALQANRPSPAPASAKSPAVEQTAAARPETTQTVQNVLTPYISYLTVIGFPETLPRVSIRVDPQEKNPSYYVPNEKSIVLSVQASRNAVFPLSEYTIHALESDHTDSQQDINQRFGVEYGVRDYLVASYLRDPNLGDRVKDVYGATMPVLQLLTQRSYGSIGPQTEPHETGAVWASAFWAMREALGAAKVDPLVVRAWRSIPRETANARYPAAMLAALRSQARRLGGPDNGTIASVLRARGFP